MLACVALKVIASLMDLIASPCYQCHQIDGMLPSLLFAVHLRTYRQLNGHVAEEDIVKLLLGTNTPEHSYGYQQRNVLPSLSFAGIGIDRAA